METALLARETHPAGAGGAAQGAALYNASSANLTNCTFYGNGAFGGNGNSGSRGGNGGQGAGGAVANIG